MAAYNIGIAPIIGVDLCSSALKTYQGNFAKATVINGNITEKSVIAKCNEIKTKLAKTTSKLIVVSGPPCQGFSMAGPRLAKDPRNKIIISVAEAISAIKPDAALVENVATILSKKHLRAIKKFKDTLTQADYFICTIELDAQDFGVPQRRRRIIFFITKKLIEKKLFETELQKFKKMPPTVAEAFANLPPALVRDDLYNDEQHNQGYFNHFAMQHSKRVKKKIALIEPGKGPMSYRKLDPNKQAGTLISGHRAPPAHFSEPRSITVREAARLQKIPDSFRIHGKFGAQMQQVSNAVPPPLAEAALKTLLKNIG